MLQKLRAYYRPNGNVGCAGRNEDGELSAVRCSLDVRSMNRIYTLITEDFVKKAKNLFFAVDSYN